MIQIGMTCLPRGLGLLRFDILSGTTWTSDCGQYHCYSLTTADDVTHSGQFTKTFSAHRNPFLILAAIWDDINDT
jgi:hypothetical protein